MGATGKLQLVAVSERMSARRGVAPFPGFAPRLMLPKDMYLMLRSEQGINVEVRGAGRRLRFANDPMRASEVCLLCDQKTCWANVMA